MITPGYNVTATERVLPRMALDFTTASLDSRVTITRALNTATRVNSSGYIEIVNANLPRFDFSPTSIGTCNGLLIEESRANICTYSQDFFNPPWATVNASLTAASGISPDGTNNATNLTFSATSGFMARATAIPISGSTTYTHSIYMRATSGTFKTKISRTNGATWVTATVSPELTLTTTWQRFDITYTSGVADTVSDFIVGAESKTPYTMPATGTIQIYGAQVEAGAFPTSYIPTVFTSLTRNADAVSMTGTNFSDWYSSSSAALAAVVIPNIATGTRPIWQLDDTTANEIIALRGNVANPELYIVDGGTPQAQLDAGTITAGTQYGLCAAFAANSCAVSQNGATPVTTATATMPTVTQARIGSDGSNFLNGAVRTLRYWPQRILNAETQAFSK